MRFRNNVKALLNKIFPQYFKVLPLIAANTTFLFNCNIVMSMLNNDMVMQHCYGFITSTANYHIKLVVNNLQNLF